MEITSYLRVLRFIYETRLWLLISMGILLGSITVYLTWKKRSEFLCLWLLVLPMFILPLILGTTWCGFRYRMELRNRYAQFPDQPVGTYNINLMPDEIYAEYARHDFHPRFRDLKAQVLTGLLLLPPYLFLVVLLSRSNWIKKQQIPDGEGPVSLVSSN